MRHPVSFALAPLPLVQSRVAGIEALKHQVEGLKVAAAESDQLESQFTALAAAASRLPVLRLQVQALQESCNEMGRLEREQERLRNVRRVAGGSEEGQ